MYTLEYLPIAREDMAEIVRYISHELGNPTAASRLAVKLLVENYLLLYWVDETTKTVTIARVVYAGRDYGKLL